MEIEEPASYPLRNRLHIPEFFYTLNDKNSNGKKSTHAMKWLKDKLSFGIGKEVAIVQVLKALTWKRLWNAAKNMSSFLLSAVTKESIVWGLPSIVNIEPTNICNLRCPLCITGSGHMQRPRGKMDFDDYKKFIDTVAGYVIYITLYHQGEPYLHPRFNDMVAYAKQYGLYVSTSSNAHYFDPESADAVVKSGLDSMIISLDGTTQESYARYRRGGKLNVVLEGIRNLVASKKKQHSKTPYLFTQFLVMKHNENEIEEMKKLCKSLGVNRLLVKTTQVMTIEEAREWLPENEKYSRYAIAGQELVVKQGTGSCPRLWLTTLIDWDGHIVPCCFDKNGEYTMGHFIEKKDFFDTWISERYQQFRQQMLKDRNSIDICRNCNYGIGLFK